MNPSIDPVTLVTTSSASRHSEVVHLFGKGDFGSSEFEPGELHISDLAVQSLLSGKTLTAHLQPVVSLEQGQIVGHEALIRPKLASSMQSPEHMLSLMRDAGHLSDFETTCLRICTAAWLAQGAPGRIFLNFSAGALIELLETLAPAEIQRNFSSLGISPNNVVIEITEHDRVTDMARFLACARIVRNLGVEFALDDFGDGRSSLRLWAELRPEIVKIDKYFISGIDRDPVKSQTVRGIIRFAEMFNTKLLAEGVETMDEARVVKDMGIEFAQGYLFGFPRTEATAEIELGVRRAIGRRSMLMLPEMERFAASRFSMRSIANRVQSVNPSTSVSELAEKFHANVRLTNICIINPFSGAPLGLVNRQLFLDGYSKPYFKEVHGKKSALEFSNRQPVIVDCGDDISSALSILTSEDQTYLTEGLIVTDEGRYFGLANGQQLVKVVTEVRIEAARHANPLTYLPGNIPITENITRLLKRDVPFVLCYGDLNDFKPFNDHYGYWKGDEMIRLAAEAFSAHCNPKRDFLGHVGGDDFVVLFQSEDWLERCERIIDQFNARAKALYDEDAIQLGGIEAEDRHGVRRFFKFTSLTVGACPVTSGSLLTADKVANRAAAIKSRAKKEGRRLLVEHDGHEPGEELG